MTQMQTIKKKLEKTCLYLHQWLIINSWLFPSSVYGPYIIYDIPEREGFLCFPISLIWNGALEKGPESLNYLDGEGGGGQKFSSTRL